MAEAAFTRERSESAFTWNAQPVQRLFLQQKAFEGFMGGAAGGGKSDTLLMFNIARRLKYPGSAGLMLRRSIEELKKEGSLIPRSHEILHGKWAWSGMDKKWRAPNGSTLEFGYCKYESDVYHYQCFIPETEVLTKNGWKKVAEVKTGELVASVNPATREIEYKVCSATQAYNHDGDIVSIYQRNGLSFRVTPNHKIWYSTQRDSSLRFREAKDLQITARIPQTFKWQGVKPQAFFTFNTPGNNGRILSFDSLSFAEFLGWYISEGCAYQKRGTVNISQTIPHKRDRIIELLKRNGVTVYHGKKYLALCNGALAQYLAQFGSDCYEKRTGDFIKSWDKEHLERFLDSMLLGDGHWYTQKRGTFVTSSLQLKDDMAEIALKCGYKVTEAIKDGWFNKGKTKIWHLYICKPKHDTEVRTYGKSCLTTEYYSGAVYCVTVPPYHSVIIRDRGRISMSGQSAQYADIEFDELTHFSNFQYEYLKSRIRSAAGVPVAVRSASNPGNIGHAWVKDRFVTITTPGKVYVDPVTGKDRVFIPARVYDNPILMKNDPGYVERLKSLPEHERRALLDGDWDVFKGQYFYEWRYDLHVVKPFPIPREWPRERSIDWGMAKPLSCHWYAISPDGRAYCYREYYATGRQAGDAGRDIRDLSQGEKYVRTWCDPSMFAKKGEGVESIAAQMQRSLGMLMPSKNERVSGWQAVRKCLSIAPDGLPFIQFFDTCVNMIRTMPQLIYDQLRVEDLDSEGEDHCFHGDTLVDTWEGLMKIKDMPKEGLVYSLDGKLKYYRSCEIIKRMAKTVTVIVENGVKIRCTPDHKFMTENGWKIALDLTDELCYSIPKQREGLCELRSSIQRYRSSKAFGIISAGNIFNEKVFAFIGWFGHFITGLFRRMVMCITRMAIDQTIRSKILNGCDPSGTSVFTAKNPAWVSGQSKSQKRQRVSGMGARKAGSGTAITLKSLYDKCSREGLKSSVPFAEKNLSAARCSHTEPNTAGLTVGRVRCVSVEEAPKADVYCLTVPETSCFLIEGGILVANCADDFRYWAVNHHQLPKHPTSEKYPGLPGHHQEFWERFAEDVKVAVHGPKNKSPLDILDLC